MKNKIVYKLIFIIIIIAIILFIFLHEKEFNKKANEISEQKTNITKFSYFAFSGLWSKDFEIYSPTKVTLTYFFKPFFGKATIILEKKKRV